MSTISSYPRPSAVYGNGNGTMGQTGEKSIQQTSVSASRDQSMDLSLKTREGDLVTINAASFSKLDGFTYDETGRIVSNGNSSTSSVRYQTMTLETGSSFTFSVNGDLSDQEMDDIEQLVNSLDMVLGEMASGDMDKAVETALGMTGYDTVASFSADLSLQRTRTMATELSGGSYSGNLASESALSLPGSSLVGKIMERITALMDEADDAIQKKSREPVDQLFAEHLKAFDRSAHEPYTLPDENKDLKYEMMADLRQRVQTLFDGIS